MIQHLRQVKKKKILKQIKIKKERRLSKNMPVFNKRNLRITTDLKVRNSRLSRSQLVSKSREINSEANFAPFSRVKS